MPSAKVKAVIFDIGRVLVRIDVAEPCKASPPGFTLSHRPLVCNREGSSLARLAGRTNGSPRLVSASRQKAWRQLHVRAIHGNLESCPRPFPIHDDAFFQELSKRYRLALLSNTDPIHVQHLEATYSFFRFFPTRIYSCAVGASKPNPLIYREALRALKVQAHEAVYIDDIAAYVEALKRLGMAGIQFESPAQLTADLKSLGVELP